MGKDTSSDKNLALQLKCTEESEYDHIIVANPVIAPGQILIDALTQFANDLDAEILRILKS